MATSANYDPALFKLIQEQAEYTRTTYGQRDAMCAAIKDMFLVRWTGNKPTGDWIKETVSPSARNKALGAMRLMYAADPVFSVPYDESDQNARSKSEKIEKAATAIWDMAGRIRQTPVHYDAIESAILYGEVQVAITATQDLVDQSKGTANKATTNRMSAIAARTPYVFEVLDPASGYPEYDALGMRSYYRRVQMLSGAVLDRWGDTAIALMGDKRDDQLYYCDYWDDQYHVAWIDGKSGVLLMEEHKLPVIPIIAQVTDGSGLFTKPEESRQPFLYTLWKSGLWERENLSLTAMYSSIFAMAAVGQFTFTAPDGTTIALDLSQPGGVNQIPPGTTLQPTIKNAVDPSLTNGLAQAQQLTTASTIYDQTLGEPLGSNAPYSMVAMLNQAGRLPLVSAQRRCGWAIAGAMEAAMRMLKDGGKKANIKGMGGVIGLSPADIPDNLIMECTLDIALPQDDRQNAALAMQLTQGQEPITSRRWAREKILKIGQSDDMDQEIYSEKMSLLTAQMAFQQAAQQAVQQQQGQQQGQPGQMPQGMPPQPGPQGMPQGQPQGQPSPEQTAMMQQAQQGQPSGGPGLDQAQAGLPMTQPMPPQGMPGGD